MILLVSNERDITTDYVVLELKRRGVPYFRLNTERLPNSRVSCQWQSGRPIWHIVFDDRSLITSDVLAGYFRRPGAPLVESGVVDSVERNYCSEEWTAVLRSIYVAVGDRWLSAPRDIARAEDKALQLALAHEVGLRVPATVITNDLDKANCFIREGQNIGKAFHSGFLDDADGEGGRVIFTTRLDNNKLPTRESLSLAPVIFQREVPKSYDVRATVVGGCVFAATIDSQIKTETTVDWRRASAPDLPHACHELPESIFSKCVSLTRLLGLRFAAIDLVLDRDGHYWFLEANPNGQWAWIESRTGLPISSAIVDELTSIAQGHEGSLQ
jgi:glutathione synthase/RimK-type ligase-like ATP-grasp enzyme